MELKAKYRTGRNYKGTGKANKGGDSTKRKRVRLGMNAPKGAGEGK
jgi:hypothetical protein